MSTKVYAYGCARPSREVRDAIEQQLWLAHRYRMALWRLDMAGRTLYREQRRAHLPELVELEECVERLEVEMEQASADERRVITAELRALRARRRELREQAKEHAGLLADAAAASERKGVLVRALRNVFSRTSGLYSGTYLHVEAAARSASAGSEDPQRPRWDGSGTLAIQLQGGRSTAQLYSGKDPSLHIAPPQRGGKGRRAGSRTQVRYRLRSDERGAAVCIELETMLHRDLPSDGKATWAKLAVKRVHEHRYHYSVQLTVESEQAASKSSGAGVVAVCFHGDQIAYACEYGEPKLVSFPVRAQKLRDLQSIRDQRRNDAIAVLTGWCERQDEAADWVRDEIAVINERKSCRRLYHLRERLRGVVDESVTRHLEEWAYKENHLYWWWADERTGTLRARKDAHRKWAAELARKFRVLVVDGRPLDDRKRLTDERRWLGLHELRTALLQAFGEDAHKMRGESCEELCERLRAEQSAGDARNGEQSSDVACIEPVKRAKRTGFARKHRARAEAARNEAANVAE